MPKGTQRRLAAIISADVVGYSRLMGVDEVGTLAALRNHRAELIDDLIAEHGGRIVKTMGDGLLLEFPSVVVAVECAIEIQTGMIKRNEGIADARLICFRFGIHLGDVIVEGDDIFGDGVNIAARIEALGEPGGVTISDDAHRQVRDRIDLEWRNGASHKVKNIARPVQIWHWAAAIPQAAASAPANDPADAAPQPVQDKPSIVVLPFNNMSGDPEQEYFSDGITEDIITDLSKVSQLFVIARNSAFVYKDKTFNVSDVCRELGVKFALEGSIRKAANRVRITAQLIDGTSGGHLWAERYDRELTDIFAVQDDVTQQIVAALKVTLSESEKSLIADGGTKDVASHDYFLKGRALMFGTKRDREMFAGATDCFRRAIELGPEYGAPLAGLAMAHVLDHQNHWSDTPERSLDQAESFVSEAIAKDGKDPFAHYVAAMVAMFKKDYERLADAADRALALNPNYAPALSIRGIVYIYTGAPAKAMPFIEEAMRLDPAFQGQYMHFLGTAHFVAGDHAAAAALFRERIAVNPSTDLSRAFLASALGHLNDMDEARRIWRELKDINPGYDPMAHMDRLPFKDPGDVARFVDGWRKAGLLE